MLENHQVELVLHWENDVSHIEPGSDLSGFIMMNVAKVIQARAVTFRFTGEKVTEVAHNWQAEIFRGRSGRPPSYNYHSIIDMNIPLEHYSLFRNGPGGSRLSPGQYQLSFHISLPDYLPDTKDWSEDGISSVSYDVKANLDYAYLDSSGSIVLRKYCLTRPVIVKEEDQFQVSIILQMQRSLWYLPLSLPPLLRTCMPRQWKCLNQTMTFPWYLRK